MEEEIDEEDSLEWTVQQECCLLDAMVGHKPVGVNRHFMMVCIHDKFSKAINKEISSDCIWKRLDTMYDMAALHESEIMPFPNDEVEFELGEEFDDLAMERLGISLPHSKKDLDVKSDSTKTGGKKLGSSKIKQNPPPLLIPGKSGSESNSGKSSLSTPSTSSVKVNKSVPSKSETNNETQEIVSSKEKIEYLSVGKNVKNKRVILYTEDRFKDEIRLNPEVRLYHVSEFQAKKICKQENFSSKKVTKDGKLDSAEGTKKTKDFSSSKLETTSTSKKGTYDKKLESSDSAKRTKDSSNVSKTETLSSKKAAKDIKVESSKDAKKTKDLHTSGKKLKHTSSTENSGSRRSGKIEATVTKKKSSTDFSGEKSVSSSKEKVDKKKTESESNSKNSTGNLKSARASVKADQSDSSKKQKHIKTGEISPKKISLATRKRRH